MLDDLFRSSFEKSTKLKKFQFVLDAFSVKAIFI